MKIVFNILSGGPKRSQVLLLKDEYLIELGVYS